MKAGGVRSSDEEDAVVLAFAEKWDAEWPRIRTAVARWMGT
jgi:hypothetical protein